MAALWDILGKAANLVQLLGLDSITVIAMIMSFLLFQQNKKQCQKLERRVQALRALLQRPTGGSIVIQHSEMGDLVSKAIEDADALVESYKKSSLWSRLRRGRSMASQFRDMRNVIESYCGLVPSINAFLLIMQANPCPPDIRIQVNDALGGVLAATESSARAEASGTDPHIHSLNIGEQERICSETDTTDDSTHNTEKGQKKEN